MTYIFLIFVVPSIMLYSSEISPTRCNNCVFILRNGFTGHYGVIAKILTKTTQTYDMRSSPLLDSALSL